MIEYVGDISYIEDRDGIICTAHAMIGTIPCTVQVKVTNEEILQCSSVYEAGRIMAQRLSAAFVNREGELTGTV